MNNDSELVYQEDSNLVAGIAGIICAPIVFALLAVVVCGFRAYKTTFQRFFLYHIIITLFYECSLILFYKSKLTLLIQDGFMSFP
jgi:hypothetical protein